MQISSFYMNFPTVFENFRGPRNSNDILSRAQITLKTVNRPRSSPRFHTGFLTWPVSCQDLASQTQLVSEVPLCSQYAAKGSINMKKLSSHYTLIEKWHFLNCKKKKKKIRLLENYSFKRKKHTSE